MDQTVIVKQSPVLQKTTNFAGTDKELKQNDLKRDRQYQLSQQTTGQEKLDNRKDGFKGRVESD